MIAVLSSFSISCSGALRVGPEAMCTALNLLPVTWPLSWHHSGVLYPICKEDMKRVINVWCLNANKWPSPGLQWKLFQGPTLNMENCAHLEWRWEAMLFSFSHDLKLRVNSAESSGWRQLAGFGGLNMALAALIAGDFFLAWLALSTNQEVRPFPASRHDVWSHG